MEVKPSIRAYILVVPSDLFEEATRLYGDTYKVICLEDLYEYPEIEEPRQKPFWQQINKEKRK